VTAATAPICVHALFRGAPCVTINPVLDQSATVAATLARHAAAVQESLSALDLGAVERVAKRLEAARLRGSTIYVAGNGGSAATAGHWVNDLCKATLHASVRRIRAMCLTDSTPWFTALANDEGYERVFSEQLEAFGSPGDVVVLLSASGNSPNLVRAADTALALDCEVLALLGFDGGALRSMATDHVLVATEPGAYELVEDVHSVVCHMIVRSLVPAA
jgi:D-sedoheptulose 7-phosphate isomerase